MEITQKVYEVSDIQKIEEGTSFLGTRFDVFSDGSKKIQGYGRVLVTDADGQTPKQGELTQTEVMEFAKGRVDEGIELVFSDTPTTSTNEDGSIPAPQA